MSNENISLKNDLDTHVCHASVASPFSVSLAYSTSSSPIENNICNLKKSVDCLGSTLSQCALNHSRLESMFRKNKFHLCMHTNHGIHMLLTFTLTTLCMLMCTLVHIVDVRATLLNFALIELMFQIQQISLFGLGKVLTPWTQKSMGTKDHSYFI